MSSKYPKVLSIGNKLLAQLFHDPVELSEKVDGSMCRINLTQEHVSIGSKKVDHTTEQMFEIAIDSANAIHQETSWQDLGDDVNLFCEYLKSPHHNTLKYDRVPKNNLYLFGALIDGMHSHTSHLEYVADIVHISPPNILSTATINNPDSLNAFLNTQSYLGGSKIEGVVIKNYFKTYDPLLLSSQAFLDFPLVGKLVNPKFSEANDKNWKLSHSKKPIDVVIEKHLTPQRFAKTIQHLKEDGLLTNEKKDLKHLIPEFYDDLMSECKDDINSIVMSNFYSNLKRRCSSFVVQSYIDHLTEKQFEE